MKILKIFFTVFLVGFLLFGFLWLRGYIQYNKDKAVWEAQVEQLNRDLSDLDVQIGKEQEDVLYWEGVAKEKEERVVEVETELAAARRDHAVVLAGIAELAPDEVVTQLLDILHLPPSEITLTPTGVVFSLDATYLMLTNMHAYDFNLKVDTPKLQEIIDLQKEEIKALALTNTGWQNTTALLYKEIAVWEQKYNGEHELRLKAEAIPQFKLFTTKNVAVGLSITAVIVGAIFIL